MKILSTLLLILTLGCSTEIAPNTEQCPCPHNVECVDGVCVINKCLCENCECLNCDCKKAKDE